MTRPAVPPDPADAGGRPPIRRVCLALPAYNEGEVIEPLLAQAAEVLGSLGLEWSIVVVDDGSRDDTAERVTAFAARPEAAGHVSLARHPQNRGLGPAIITGLQEALKAGDGADCMIVGMDADLTHPPATIPSMQSAIDDGADLVIASRFQPGSRQVGVPWYRGVLSWGAARVFDQFLAIPGVRDYTCGFRGFRASLIARAMRHYGPQGLITRAGFACTDELLVHLVLLGPVLAEVPFILRYDLKRGKSKMNVGLTIVETFKLLRAHRGQLRARRSKG